MNYYIKKGPILPSSSWRIPGMNQTEHKPAERRNDVFNIFDKTKKKQEPNNKTHEYKY